MSLDALSLKGKNALVTGAQQGLGAGIAVGLAEAGANVMVHGIEAAKADAVRDSICKLGVRALSVVGDVCDPAVCERMVGRTVEEFGSIDILVNNAGIIRRAPAVEHPYADWLAVIETNLNAVFRLCQLAGRHMVPQGSGKIINIASLLSFQGGITVPGYAAAKGGVAQLTKALANEWASKGVNVNAIAPGYMATDNTAALRADPQRSKAILERIPAGRWGTPQDLAGPAVFLASSASDYVNGHVLVVDGAWMGR